METIFNTINELQNTYTVISNLNFFFLILFFMIPEICFFYHIVYLNREIKKLKERNNKTNE